MAVRAGIASGEYPVNGKSTGNYPASKAAPDLKPALPYCFYCAFKKNPQKPELDIRELSGTRFKQVYVMNLWTKIIKFDLKYELATDRQEKAGKSLTFHRLEQQSITRSIKQHKAEIVSFKKAARDCVNASPWLQRGVELLSTVPDIGERTAWLMMVVLSSRQFQCAAEVASFLGLNPIEKRSGKSEYRKPRLSKSGSKHFRQALYFTAMVATRRNPDVQALYEPQVSLT